MSEEWWPSETEYTPNISKDEWLKLLKDEKVFNFNSLCMMKRFLHHDGEATCAELAKKYGRTASSYQGISLGLAQRIKGSKTVKCKQPPEREENARWWPILYVGRRVTKEDNHEGVYIWKLRPELKAALEEIGLLDDEKYPLYEQKTKLRYWVFNHTYTDATQDDVSDLIQQAEDYSYALMQYEYNKQKNQVVTPTYRNAQNINIGDVIFLRGKKFLYAYGFAISPRNSPTQILSLQKIIDDNACEYTSSNSDDIIHFEDAPALYFNFSEGEDGWGERIDVDKWRIFSEKVDVHNVEFKDSLPYPPIREITKLSAEKILEAGEINMSQAEKLADLLKNTHNLILHGAPGTGKTHLAKEIARELGAEWEMVQFHPSYDYTDFVEGLRPVNAADGISIGFERKDGVFKAFCARALKNLNVKEKFVEESYNENKVIHSKSLDDEFECLYQNISEEINRYNIIQGQSYSIIDGQIKYETSTGSGYSQNIQKNKLKTLFEYLRENQSDIDNLGNRNKQKDVLGVSIDYTYYKPILKEMLSYCSKESEVISSTNREQILNKIEEKPFIFIIDEINRGEISKIFGELFFSIDPGYRGEKGKISTQYQNLIEAGDAFADGFFVPENVYIIGTMNDIDRSVESMDLAMRRRFTFKEITAEESQKAMLTKENPRLSDFDDELIAELNNRMTNLNNAIVSEEIGLPSAFQIGAAYFLKFTNYKQDETSDIEAFSHLWEYNLEPLLREYLRGEDEDGEKLKSLRTSYENPATASADTEKSE